MTPPAGGFGRAVDGSERAPDATCERRGGQNCPVLGIWEWQFEPSLPNLFPQLEGHFAEADGNRTRPPTFAGALVLKPGTARLSELGLVAKRGPDQHVCPRSVRYLGASCGPVASRWLANALAIDPYPIVSGRGTLVR